MNIRDYTFRQYGQLLDQALENGYTFYTVREYLTQSNHESPYIVIRHDVDRKVGTARSMASLEAERGVGTTYYLRTSTFSPETATTVAGQGHEIGYHYEDLAKTRGEFDASHERFAANLARFREHADVQTICPHGSPLSSHHNLDMWDRDRTLAEYGLLGEAYLSMDTNTADPERPTYLSDTGRKWGANVPGFGRITTTDDLIEGLESDACERLYLIVHPGRWSRTPVEHTQRVAWDLAAETGKSVARRAHTAQRSVATLSLARHSRQLTNWFIGRSRR